jgi:hypothetical protein
MGAVMGRRSNAARVAAPGVSSLGASRRWRQAKAARWNKNVRLAMAVTFLNGAARGVWAYTTLSVYLKELCKDSRAPTTAVGAAEGIQGVAQAVAAIAAGYAADQLFRRDSVLYFSGAVGLLSVAFMLAVLRASGDYVDDRERYWLLTVSLALMGMHQGVSQTCLDTLFADSVKTGQRSKFNTVRFALTQLSSISGPAICVALFVTLGNEWTRDRLTLVFSVGLLLNLVPIALMFLLKDEYSLGLDSESHFIPSTPGSVHGYQRLVDEVIEQQQAEEEEDAAAATAAASAAQHFASQSPYAPLRPGARGAGAALPAPLRIEPLGATSGGAAANAPDGVAAGRSRSRSLEGGRALVGGEGDGGSGALAPLLVLGLRRVQGPPSPRPARGGWCDRLGWARCWRGADPKAWSPARSSPSPPRLPPNRSLPEPPVSCLFFTQEHIVTLIVVSDVVSALASGMTVKFFPLFFKQSLGMDPVTLNCVYIALPLFMTAVSVLAQRLAKHHGRAQVSTYINLAGCAALFGLAACGARMNNNDAKVIMPIYFLSTLQHCTRPLKRAVLMDYVPKKRRARINSIESVTRLNWSGSAVLGGMSIDKYGFGHLFLATACIQLVSWVIFALILPLVPINESERIKPPEDEEDEDEDDLDDDDSSLDGRGEGQVDAHSEQGVNVHAQEDDFNDDSVQRDNRHYQQQLQRPYGPR